MNEKLQADLELIIEKLEVLRQNLCDLENTRQPVGKSILSIDRIDQLLPELKDELTKITL